MADTVFRIQVGDEEFQTIFDFVKEQGLKPKSFDEARIKGKYTVVVFDDLTVKRCFITGTSLPNMMRARGASRGGQSFSIYRDDILEIWQ